MRSSVMGPSVMGALLVLSLGFVGHVANDPSSEGHRRATTDAGERRGWLDGATLTPAQRRRTTDLATSGSTDRTRARSVKDALSREDVELLRQDARRAMAAYPSVPSGDLLEGLWMPFDRGSRVPSDWGGANSEGVEVDGRWYLEGAAYLDLVRPAYPDRETPERTLAYLAEATRNRALARAKREELHRSSFGTGGALDVRCSVRDGCVVRASPEGSQRGTRSTFPFVAADWASKDAFTFEEIEAMPSFAAARVEAVTTTPVGVVVTYVTGSIPVPGGL